MTASLWEADIWFRVPRHPQFHPDRAYRAVAISDYAESATAQVFLVSDRGYLWGVRQNECVCVTTLSRPLVGAEKERCLPSERIASDFDPPKGGD